MKKLLLLLFVSNFALSQNAIDVRLVNPNVGGPVFTFIQTYWQSTNTSNDAGLNAILNAYGATIYDTNDNHPYQPYQNKTKIISGNVSQEFVDALSAYSGVIASAKLTNNREFSDALTLKLININVGAQVGTSNGIVVTNDVGLNTIFQNFGVFDYRQLYPNAQDSGNNIRNYFSVVCDCDKNLLNAALLNYNSVIQTTENVQGGLQLSNQQFEKPRAIISPNPFSNDFTIETEQTITNYSIVDITGKTILTTSSKAALDNKSPQLSAGIYILNLEFENGLTTHYKLVKK